MFNKRDGQSDDAVMTSTQKERYIELRRFGNCHSDALYQVDVTPASFKFTKQADAGWAKEIAKAVKAKPQQIEAAIHKSATGHTEIVKTVYQVSLDDEGRPERDDDGEQLWFAVRREVTSLPPNSSVLSALLKRKEDAAGDDNPITPDELLEALEKAAKK
jgi:hypothetical protein